MTINVFLGIVVLFGVNSAHAQEKRPVNILDKNVKLVGVKVTQSNNVQLPEQNALLVQALSEDLSAKDPSSTSFSSSSSSSSSSSHTRLSTSGQSQTGISDTTNSQNGQSSQLVDDFVKFLRSGSTNELTNVVAKILELPQTEREIAQSQIEQGIDRLSPADKHRLLEDYKDMGFLSVAMQSFTGSGNQERSNSQVDSSTSNADTLQQSIQGTRTETSVTVGENINQPDEQKPQPFLGITGKSDRNIVPSELKKTASGEQTSTRTLETRTQTVIANENGGQKVSTTKISTKSQTNNPQLNENNVMFTTGDGTIIDQSNLSVNQQSANAITDGISPDTKVHEFLDYNPNFDMSGLQRDQMDLAKREMEGTIEVGTQTTSDIQGPANPIAQLIESQNTANNLPPEISVAAEANARTRTVDSVDTGVQTNVMVGSTAGTSARRNVVAEQTSGRAETLRTEQPANELARIRQMNRQADSAARQRARALTSTFDFTKEFETANEALIKKHGKSVVYSWLRRYPTLGRTMVQRRPSRFSTFRTVGTTVDVSNPGNSVAGGASTSSNVVQEEKPQPFLGITGKSDRNIVPSELRKTVSGEQTSATSASGNSIVGSVPSTSGDTGVDTEIIITPTIRQNNIINTVDNFPRGNSNVQFVPMGQRIIIQRRLPTRRRIVNTVVGPNFQIRPTRRIMRRRPVLFRGPFRGNVRIVNQGRVPRRLSPIKRGRRCIVDINTDLCITGPRFGVGPFPDRFNRYPYPIFPQGI